MKDAIKKIRAALEAAGVDASEEQITKAVADVKDEDFVDDDHVVVSMAEFETMRKYHGDIWDTAAPNIPTKFREYFHFPVDDETPLTVEELGHNISKLAEYQRIGAFEVKGDKVVDQKKSLTSGQKPKGRPEAIKLPLDQLSKMSPAQMFDVGYVKTKPVTKTLPTAELETMTASEMMSAGYPDKHKIPKPPASEWYGPPEGSSDDDES